MVEVGEGPQVLALHDLTGFEGRCDAIYLCPEDAAIPPNDADALAAWRAAERGEAGPPTDVVEADFVMYSGGMVTVLRDNRTLFGPQPAALRLDRGEAVVRHD